MSGVTTAFVNEDGTFPVDSDALNMADVRCQNIGALFQQPGRHQVEAGFLVRTVASGRLRLSVSGTKVSRDTNRPTQRTLAVARSVLSTVRRRLS